MIIEIVSGVRGFFFFYYYFLTVQFIILLYSTDNIYILTLVDNKNVTKSNKNIALKNQSTNKNVRKKEY